MTIEIKPGYSTETVLTYPSRGNQGSAVPTSALKIFFELEDGASTNFKIKGNDLVYTHHISLEDSLLSKPFQLMTLDKRYINVNIDKMATPQAVHTIKGEGMPILDSKCGEKGDLHIQFEVSFPKVLPPAIRQ